MVLMLDIDRHRVMRIFRISSPFRITLHRADRDSAETFARVRPRHDGWIKLAREIELEGMSGRDVKLV